MRDLHVDKVEGATDFRFVEMEVSKDVFIISARGMLKSSGRCHYTTGVPALKHSHNVASITDHAVGDIGFTHTNAFVNRNVPYSLTGQFAWGSAGCFRNNALTLTTPSDVRIHSYEGNGLYDPQHAGFSKSGMIAA